MNGFDIFGMVDDLERWVKQTNEDARDDGTDLWDVAAAVARSMPRADVDKAATVWLVKTVREDRRSETRQVEQASSARPRRRPTAAEQAERAEERFQDLMRFGAQIESMMKDYAAAKFTEWTQELLDSGFSLPDGTVVKWGTATVEQHQQRVDMFRKSAEASVEAGARHQQAIDLLTESGATCLNDYIREGEN